MEIKVMNICYTIDELDVLNKLNIKFKEGSINAIIGNTGAGKTSFLEILNGLVEPTAGKIITDKYEIDGNLTLEEKNNIHLSVGYVCQTPRNQFFFKTVEKEIGYQLKYLNYKNNRKRIIDALKMVGLDETYLLRDPISLSSGENLLVLLSSALVINPDVLVIDELSIGLDYIGKKNVIKILKTIKRRYNKTIIIVSQDVDFVFRIIDYVYIMHNGKIVLEGDKYTVFTNDILEKYNISVPKIIEFEKYVLSHKKIKLGYRDEVNDLLKDILRNK